VADPFPRVTLRPAGPADAEAIARVFVAARRDALPGLADPHGFDDTVRFFRDVVAARRQVRVAVADGGVTGFVAFGGGEVEHLYVAPGSQGHGLGARLLALATAEGTPLELWVFQRNARARAFYERHGWRLVELTDGARNEEREPDARYRWEPRGPARGAGAGGAPGPGDGPG
jgi:GNAT superfamily N-acetyltransferase